MENQQVDTLFSIIIPFQKWTAFLDECLGYISLLESNKYEVILLPDDDIVIPENYSKMLITVIKTGHVSPAIKRDKGAECSTAKYLAFIDDDAYPTKNWLTVAEQAFNNDPDIAAIGGAGITPDNDPFWAKVSGAVFISKLSGGFPERYVPYGKKKYVDDWPSVNLIIKQEAFEEIGGYDSTYWPGEDSKLCNDLIKKHYKIAYIPELIVYHHRRADIKKHMRQIGNYGFHRGYFAKCYPENSRKLIYFMPLLLVLYIVLGGMLSTIIENFWYLYIAGMVVYAGALVFSFFEVVRHKTVVVAICSVPYVVLTHMWYGIRFAFGLCKDSYKASLGR